MYFSLTFYIVLQLLTTAFKVTKFFLRERTYTRQCSWDYFVFPLPPSLFYLLMVWCILVGAVPLS